jgi:predicted anti-sigma-YlaC factor YlaD
MRNLVHRFAEGKVTGVLLKYVKYHVGSCARCRQAVEVIKATILKLKALSETVPILPDERWASIEAAWGEVEDRGPP